MDKLWRVEIRGNNTLKVSMEELDKLERALVNDIAVLKVKNCVRLCKLRIYDMQKGDIVLNGCTNIDAVEVRGSTLKRLNLQNLKRLVYLDLGCFIKIFLIFPRKYNILNFLQPDNFKVSVFPACSTLLPSNIPPP